MEDKIEIDEYVRTKNGVIDKVDALYGMIENTVHLENLKWFDIKNIVKHSKQLIDLIEVKDLVCFKNKLQNSLENEEMIIHIFNNETLQEVKQAIDDEEIEIISILTKEQYIANCYKVRGEDEC